MNASIPLTIHDSDRKAAEAILLMAYDTGKTGRESWWDHTLHIYTGIIARHHAEERAAVEKAIGSLQSRISELNEIRVRVVDERDTLRAAVEKMRLALVKALVDSRAVAQELRDKWSCDFSYCYLKEAQKKERQIERAEAALTALRTTSQSTTK